MDKEELKYLKRAIANAKTAKAIEYEGIIFEGDEYISLHKQKLKKYNLAMSIIAPIVWLLLVNLFQIQSQVINFVILVSLAIGFYIIHEQLVKKFILDDSFKHMKKS